MKNFFIALLGVFAALPLCAASNIKMVTYFPVPYASYNDLKVSGTCDVGLLGKCDLDAGSSLNISKDAAQPGRAYNEGKLDVLRGTLALNGSGSAYGETMQFGTNSVSGGELQFKHNLDVTNMPGSAITSIQVSNQAKLNKLNLFDKYDFPGCDGTGNEINWKRMTVNGAEGVFLVCGAGTEVSCKGTKAELTNVELPMATAQGIDTCDGNVGIVNAAGTGYYSGSEPSADLCNRGSCDDYYMLATVSGSGEEEEKQTGVWDEGFRNLTTSFRDNAGATIGCYSSHPAKTCSQKLHDVIDAADEFIDPAEACKIECNAQTGAPINIKCDRTCRLVFPAVGACNLASSDRNAYSVIELSCHTEKSTPSTTPVYLFGHNRWTFTK